MSAAPQSVLQFAPKPKQAAAGEPDPLDTAGKSILGLLREAAGVIEQSNQQALEFADRLSGQLRNAESRIQQLETAVRYYQDRAERAEQWLSDIATEIEQRFLRRDDDARAGPSPAALMRNRGRRS